MDQHQCPKHPKSEFYVYNRSQRTGKNYYRCKACNSEGASNARRKKKRILVERLGGQCIKCGYKKAITALEFHHSTPEHKDFSISFGGNNVSLERMWSEAQKCELLCANCHREEHERLAELNRIEL